MSRVFEDEFMDVQAEMVEVGLDFKEKISESVSKMYILIFFQSCSFSASVFFKSGNQILEWNDMQIKGGYETFTNVFFQREYELSRKLRKVCEVAGRPCPEELRLTYDLVTEEFDAEYGYDVPEGIRMDELCEVWIKELREKQIAVYSKTEVATKNQGGEPAKAEQPKKAGFKFPFIWKK